MKILWLINIMLPEISKVLNKKIVNSGGWLITLSEMIQQKGQNELVICYPDSETKKVKLDNSIAYGFKYDDREQNIKKMEIEFGKILRREKPDIIHIWGTEHLHSYAMVQATKNEKCLSKVVVSIQGMTSIYTKHYMGGLPGEIQKKFSMRDFVRRDSFVNQQRRMEQRGKYEKEVFQKINHVIGRTNWDYICSKFLNPNIYYHFNNEILRKDFYESEWNIKHCQKHTIIVSQAQNPIKGFHFVLEAIAMLKNKYDDVKVYVAGSCNPLKKSFKNMYYFKYLNQLSNRLKVSDFIDYVGNLNSKEMCKMYLKSNVFISASSIENSSNSIGEAMLLGMPVVASYVGGTNDLLRDKEEGFLYAYDEPYMLAGYIDRIFANDELAVKIGTNARKHALVTHNKEENYFQLMNIYNEINKDGEKKIYANGKN